MAIRTSVSGQIDVPAAKPLIGGKSFDAIFLIASFWLIGGTYADAWAHGHLKLDTFFTPWHGVLYTGVLAVAAVLAGTIAINHRRGATWHKAIPTGYDLSVFGIFAMFFIGVGDGVWHTLFGIEQNTDAALSPTHLAAVVCITLAISGPYRALYQRKEQPSSLRDYLLLGVALAMPLGEISNYSQGAHPFDTFWPLTATIQQSQEQLFAIVSFVFQAIILTGLVLYTIRRWRLSFGFFTLVLTLVAIAMSFMRDHYIVIMIALLAGVIIDTAYYLLKPTLKRPGQFRLFATIASAALFAVYILTMVIMGGVVWTIHMTVGSVVLTGITGWLLSYLVLPGQLPEGVSE